MGEEITRYLELADKTKGLTEVTVEILEDEKNARMIAAGIGSYYASDSAIDPHHVLSEWERKSAISFDIETAVTTSIYVELRKYGDALFEKAKEITSGFTSFQAELLIQHPEVLPLYQHIAGIFSKSTLKKQVGTVADTGFSVSASKKLAELLAERVNSDQIIKSNVLKRLDSTLEGIIRDLVGRVLLEEVVSNALLKEGVPFLRESQYKSIPGVIYDFRADFVIPTQDSPVAFIEVRKSSSRHASLYAKDKMFSAINWKGRHKKLIGVIVVEGDWTSAALKSMAKIFDYVIPLKKANDLARILKKAVDGDQSVLKWLVEFKIEQSPDFH